MKTRHFCLFTVSVPVPETVSSDQCYDSNGNLTNRQAKGMSGEVTNYVYNSENQLVEVKWYVGADLQKEAKYTYGALGKRISKEIIDHQDSSKSFSRGYIYSGNEILYEFNGEQELLATYTHSTMRTDDVLSIDVTSEGVNAGKAPSARSYFYLKDGLGSVVDVVDSSGSKVQHHVYSAFGKLIKIEDGNGVEVTDAPEVAVFFAFTGREMDSETGLYYYRARYYSPELGRFLGVDPDAGRLLSPLTSINKYIYAINSPINRIDPNGQFSFKKALAIGLALISPITAIAYINLEDGVFSKKDTRRITNFAVTATVFAAALYLSPAIAIGTLLGTAYSRKDKGNPFDDLHFAGEFALSFGIAYGGSQLMPGSDDSFFGRKPSEGFWTSMNRTSITSIGLTIGLSSFARGLSSEERSERRGIGLFLFTFATLAPN